MSSSNVFSNNNSINQLNTILNNTNNNNNNNSAMLNLIPQRRIPVMGINPFLVNNSLPNRLLNQQINGRYSANSNNNLFLRNLIGNNNINNENNDQEAANNNNIYQEQNEEVSPMEIDNQVVYTQYEVEEDDKKEKIETLINLLELQFTKKNYEIDFQLVYAKTYEICILLKANELYKEVENLLKKVVNNFLQEISKINDNEKENFPFMNKFIECYNFYKLKISQTGNALSYLDKIYKKNLVAAGGDQTQINKGNSIKDRAMNIYYENLIFNESIKEKILNVLKREYLSIRNKNFKNSKIFKEFLEIITNKGYGNEFYNTEILQLIINETKNYYGEFANNVFEKELHSPESENDEEKKFKILKSYLLNLSDLIKIEEEYLFNIEEKNIILNHILDICVMNNNVYDIIIEYCIKKLFILNDAETFQKIYNLFFAIDYVNKEDCTSKFITSFNNIINKLLNEICQNFIIYKSNNNNSNTNNTNNTTNSNNKIEYLNFYKYIDEIYKLKKKCRYFLANAMNNNTKIDHVVKVNFEKIINGENSDTFNDAFGKLIHEEIKLCQKIKNNESLLEFKEKFQCIFKYINNKDLFEENYRKLLGRRLLRNSSMIKENESIFYEVMKEENGYNYVKKIEKMINDIFYSQNINFDFRKKYINNNINLPTEEFYVKLLSQESWPFDEYVKKEIKSNNPIVSKNSNTFNTNTSISINSSQNNLNIINSNENNKDNKNKNNNNIINENNKINQTNNSINNISSIVSNKKTLKYPANLTIYLDLFEKYFHSQFKHRYLTYVPSLSWAEIYTIPGIFSKSNKSFTFIVSFYQISLLSFFKTKNLAVSIKTLCENFNMNEEELETHYHFLIKSGLLIKKNGELVLNSAFDSDNEKINLNYRGVENSKKNSQGEKKEISHFILEDRKYQIDATIMHVLKKHRDKEIDFNFLKENLVNYLKNFFVPEENIIKTRINNLLERNLIVKSTSKEDCYSYVP